MKGTGRIIAACMAAGVFVASFVWFAWSLPWQGLGIGFFVGLILYERMTRHAAHEAIVSRRDWADRKPGTVKETVIFGLPPTN